MERVCKICEKDIPFRPKEWMLAIKRTVKGVEYYQFSSSTDKNQAMQNKLILLSHNHKVRVTKSQGGKFIVWSSQETY